MGSNSFSLVAVAIVGAILLSQGLVEARGKNVSPFCEKATHHQLCNIMVGKAATPKDATLNSLKLTRDLAAKIPPLTSIALGTIEGLCPVRKGNLINHCTEVFNSAVVHIGESIAAVEAGDNFTAANRLSAFGFSGCSNGIKEFGAAFPMSKVVTQFERQLSNCLAIVQA